MEAFRLPRRTGQLSFDILSGKELGFTCFFLYTIGMAMVASTDLSYAG